MEDVVKDPETIEATGSTVDNLDPVQLDDNDHSKKAYVGHKLQEQAKKEPGECLLIYLTVSEVPVSAVLVREDKGLRLALKYRARRVILRCDSQLVINQVTWTFQIKEQRLKKYQAKICKLLLEFDECRFDQIPRAQNNEADELAKLAIVTKRVTGKGNMVALYSSIGQIEEGILPDDKKEAKKLRIQLARSRSILSDTRAGSDHLYMEKHCVPFRPPQRDQLRQRTPTGKKVIEFFERWHIKKILSTPYHPAGNGQAESSNKSIQGIMKKKLENAKGLWPELLPEVLWAYRTIPMMSTGETPYLLVYGTDAVIPVEVGEPSLIYSHKSGPRNDESRMHDLDEADERRDMAYIRMVAQKQQAEHYYNKKAKIKPLKVGDYVLKAKTQASRDPREGKLGTNWDGPYKITATAGKGSFQLETMEGKRLPNNWNVTHLKDFNF
ncbi:uncharacterized protein [Nicotiana tomentosiformis]|uniref:uncharacterized protein n=1 Tax=Nicotiana tomentosiformis TaxID=4098 RepID=UPI00388C8E1A